jgi:hypothetical protein
MATPEKLLSTKNAEKADKLDANKEDKDIKDVGGPESDWTTANYANFKFDATLGVSPDTTILSKAKVKAEKADSLKEEGETCKKCHEDMEDCMCESLDAANDKEDMDESFLTAEDDKDDPADASVEDEAPASDEGDQEDDSMDLDLADLMDNDEDVIDLTPSEDEGQGEEDAMSSEDEGEGVDVTPDEDVEEGYQADDDMMWGADDDSIKVEAAEEDGEDESEKSEEDEDESEEDDDDDEDEKETVEEEKSEDDDEDEDEKKEKKEKKEKVEEGKFRISFKSAEINKLFENNTVLTEEDKRQSRAIFESAVRTVAKDMGKQLQEAYQARFAKVKKQHESKVAKQVDAYLSYVVEQWVKDNKVALQQQLRNRLTESFINGFKKLCTEHYIEVPQSKVNVVEALAKNVKSLKSKLKDAETQNVKLHEESKEAVKRERIALRKEHKARLIAEAASTITASERGEFKNRAETVKFTTTKEFKKNLVALREQYFVAKKSVERPSNEPAAAPLFEEKRRPASPVDVYTQIADKWSGQS